MKLFTKWKTVILGLAGDPKALKKKRSKTGDMDDSDDEEAARNRGPPSKRMQL